LEADTDMVKTIFDLNPIHLHP